MATKIQKRFRGFSKRIWFEYYKKQLLIEKAGAVTTIAQYYREHKSSKRKKHKTLKANFVFFKSKSLYLREQLVQIVRTLNSIEKSISDINVRIDQREKNKKENRACVKKNLKRIPFVKTEIKDLTEKCNEWDEKYKNSKYYLLAPRIVSNEEENDKKWLAFHQEELQILNTCNEISPQEEISIHYEINLDKQELQDLYLSRLQCLINLKSKNFLLVKTEDQVIFWAMEIHRYGKHQRRAFLERDQKYIWKIKTNRRKWIQSRK
eukprot:snap_masked-scaffold_27-processed-gene-0.18-mRNA-1 protein AED:1.00 eAED:1.00 QI:0/-1/0/0/-1/1/1/0/263